MIYLIDILKEVTEKTRANKQLDNLFYLYAPIDEIINTIASMAKSTTNQEYIYPFVAIPTDITEEKGNRSDMQSRVSLPMVVFAVPTKPDITAMQRYDESFRYTLAPIYEQWMSELFRHNDIFIEDELLIEHRYTERLSWGKSKLWANSGQSVDYIDAIELNNLDFWIRKPSCRNSNLN